MTVSTRPWWLADSGRDVAGEMLGLRLLGLADRRLDRVLSALLLALLIASRLAALPSGPWDQDEAYLALGVLELDPGRPAPHPPWFPLWIVVGKLLQVVTGDPFRALAVAGAVAGGLLAWPVAALWARVLERRLALFSALLVAAAPGPWLLAARGTTEAPATALLAAAAAIWLASSPPPRSLVAGSVLLGSALLVRPQLLPAALLLAVWRTRGGRVRATLVPASAVLGLGVAGLVAVVGGPGVLVGAAREHLALHASGLADNRYDLAAWCLPRALGSGLAGALYGALAVLGSLSLVRVRRLAPEGTVVLVTLVAPLLLASSLLQNGTLARYATPLLALSSGVAVCAVAVLAGRWASLVVGAAVAALVLQTAPALTAARAQPPVAAAFARAAASGRPVVADDRLHAFVILAGRSRDQGPEILLETPARLGALSSGVPVSRVSERWVAAPPPGAALVRPAHPLLERLAAGRFVRLMVVSEDL